MTPLKLNATRNTADADFLSAMERILASTRKSIASGFSNANRRYPGEQEDADEYPRHERLASEADAKHQYEKERGE